MNEQNERLRCNQWMISINVTCSQQNWFLCFSNKFFAHLRTKTHQQRIDRDTRHEQKPVHVLVTKRVKQHSTSAPTNLTPSQHKLCKMPRPTTAPHSHPLLQPARCTHSKHSPHRPHHPRSNSATLLSAQSASPPPLPSQQPIHHTSTTRCSASVSYTAGAAVGVGWRKRSECREASGLRDEPVSVATRV